MQTESHTKVRSSEEEHVKMTTEEPQQQQGGGLFGTLKGALGLGGEKGATGTTTTSGPSAEEEVHARVEVAAPTTPSRSAASKVSFWGIFDGFLIGLLCWITWCRHKIALPACYLLFFL